MVFMRKSAPAGDGVYAFKTPKNYRILWKSTDEAQSGPRSRERLATCGTGIPGPRARLLGHPRARIAVASRRCGTSANRTQPNIVIASHTKNAAFAATSAAPNSLWFRRVATAATRYTPTGNNPHTKKRGVNARYAEVGPTSAAATSSGIGRLRASPNEAASTLSATAGQKSKTGCQKSTKSTS